MSDEVVFNDERGYEDLEAVLREAYDQAATGKGRARHATDKSFIDQPMFQIADLLATDKGHLFQAVKKIQESTRLDKEAAIKERLGAIVYLASSIIYLRVENGA